MDKLSKSNAKNALDQMKLEIANEMDASLTNEERQDGTTVSNLVNRAEKKISEKENQMK